VPPTVTVDLAAFAQIVKRVTAAAGTDLTLTLPMLTATQLRIADDELALAATDRFRPHGGHGAGRDRPG